MDARDIIDELSLQTDDIDSLLGIMENIIIELDEKTSNSRDRNKILKIIGKFGKALVRHNVQYVNVLILNALTILINAKSESASDFLTASECGLLVNKGTYLKYVRIIPTLF